jgi:sigma-B regulation protein RsbU (phosphoserine phosphatase)
VETKDLGFPIGLEEDISDFVDTLNIPFGAGDLVLLYTDGITEAESPSGELFGIDRLCECLMRLRESRLDAIVIGVVDAVMRHMETQKMHDDITLVVLKHR